MRVECVFFGQFREAVGEKSVTLETEARTVGDLLGDLPAEFPSLEGRLMDGEALAGSVAVTIDGVHVQQRAGLQTPLDDGAVVRITQAIHGG